MLTIRQCESAADFAAATDLTDELGAWDSAETAKLGFVAQDVLDFYYKTEGEPADAWLPPSGSMLLGHVDAEVAGCIACRYVAPSVCELKRLYVRPRFRQTGLGRALVLSLIDHASAARFTTIRLETVQFMRGAIRLYERMGFVAREPYYEIPEIFHPITIFMERDLGTIAAAPGEVPGR
jgi:ribosomal protein S18 acetylase RimI-like enzyme